MGKSNELFGVIKPNPSRGPPFDWAVSAKCPRAPIRGKHKEIIANASVVLDRRIDYLKEVRV